MIVVGGVVLAVVGVEGAVVGVAVALVTVMVTVVVLGSVVVANVPGGISPVLCLARLALRRASLAAFSSFYRSTILRKALTQYLSRFAGSVSCLYSLDPNMRSTSGSHC